MVAQNTLRAASVKSGLYLYIPQIRIKNLCFRRLYHFKLDVFKYFLSNNFKFHFTLRAHEEKQVMQSLQVIRNLLDQPSNNILFVKIGPFKLYMRAT